ncbi:hypothetical protein ACFL0F_01985, partial [Patescibacteria group bacterium]
MSLKNNKNTATETPKGVNINKVVETIQSVCTLPDELIKTALAISISSKLNLSSSLWLMIVGVPSSAKTDLVNFLKSFRLTYFIDTLTQNPFASGFKGAKGVKTYDLLPELNGKCFIVKDYTTIFSLNDETVKKLLGELVSIYDGEFRKFSPTRGLKKYTTNFSHIGCITPSALNRHAKYMNIIGPRFMFYRIPKLNDKNSKKGFKIAWQDDRKGDLKKVRKYVRSFLNRTIKEIEGNTLEIDFTDEKIKANLEHLAVFTSKS